MVGMGLTELLWSMLGCLIAARAYCRGSLTLNGAVTAALVASTSAAASSGFAIILLAFYMTSVKATRTGRHRKEMMMREEASQTRTATQVLCNSGVGTLYAVLYRLVARTSVPLQGDEYAKALEIACVSFYACCAGDTWASEFGVLQKNPPILVSQPFRVVPPGTNGGVSLVGTLASVAGGMFIGFVYWLYATAMNFANGAPSSIILVAALSGFIGSMLDSVLGAELQFTGVDRDGKVCNDTERSVKLICGRNVLNNNQVNLLASTSTSLIVGGLHILWPNMS